MDPVTDYFLAYFELCGHIADRPDGPTAEDAACETLRAVLRAWCAAAEVVCRWNAYVAYTDALLVA